MSEPLTVKDLARLGREMRSSQRDYFRRPTPEHLAHARGREREFDQAVHDVLSQLHQTNLFPGSKS